MDTQEKYAIMREVRDAAAEGNADAARQALAKLPLKAMQYVEQETIVQNLSKVGDLENMLLFGDSIREYCRNIRDFRDVGLLQKLDALNPRSPWTQYHLGLAAIRDGDTAKAHKYFRFVQDRNPYFAHSPLALQPSELTALVSSAPDDAPKPYKDWLSYQSLIVPLTAEGLNFKKTMDAYAAYATSVQLIEIGAMDGVSWDPIRHYVTSNNWHALMVEPLDVYFKQLQQNYRDYPNVRFENTAISNQPGEAEMVMVDPEAIKSGLAPEYTAGMSRIDTDGSSLPSLAKHLIRKKVRLMTVDELLEKHQIKTVNVIQIDAEGHDYEILACFDADAIQCDVINIEFTGMDYETRVKTLNYMKKFNFRTVLQDHNLLAVRQHVMQAMGLGSSTA